jgi:multidrug efflux pump subunit AcrA (membrane-fusion protein)
VKRKVWLSAAGAASAAAIAAGVAVGGGAGSAAPTPKQPPTNTAKVSEGTLSATVSLAGILTYRAQPDGSPYLVVNQVPGTYTKLPELGHVVSQGQVLYRVDDSPVVLLYGSTPAYRTLSVGATGADVAQLNADLVALGYATSVQLDPASASFGPVTAAALEKLQAAIGLSQNGMLTLGQAVFEPTAVRVTARSAQVGAGAQPGQTVMQATSTARVVQVALDASQQTDMAVGDKVTITLPDNHTTPGVVSSVGTVATCPSTPGPGGSGSGSAAPGTDACSSGGSASTTTPTVTVDVDPSDPTATGTWDQAPVRVSITTASVPNAMAVPVTALLAQSTGGYAVEVVGPGGTNRLVPVSLGLFDDADGLVQVTGPGLTAGEQVVVPAI